MIPAVDYTVQAANGKNLKAAEAASKQWVDGGDIPIKTIDRSVPTLPSAIIWKYQLKQAYL